MNQRKFLGKQLSEDIKKKEEMNRFLVVQEMVYNVEIARTLKNSILNCEHLVDLVESSLSLCSSSDRSLLLLSEHRSVILLCQCRFEVSPLPLSPFS